MTDISASNANQLKRNSLGLAAVTFLVVSAAAPLTGVAGAVPVAMLLGNGAGIPFTFLFMTIVMLIFAVGYVAMARYVKNAGAFYAYTARGLGGRMGGAVSMIALVSYNAMQFGLLGLVGAIASGVFGGMGLNLPWWVYSLIAIGFVGVLGYCQVEISARLLTLLVALEYIIVLIVDFAIIGKGGAGGLSFNFFDMGAISSGSFTAALLFCLGSFIGFEATTIYAEEARDPERTIPRATFLSVLLIGLFFIFTTWLMVVGTGADKLVPTIGALKDPTTFFFDMAGQYVGEPVPTLMGLLLVSSLFAALSAFHSYIARYTYVAGREGLLPSMFGVTHDRFQSPHIGSIAQTICSLIAVGVFAGLGLDPFLNLFTWISQLGTMGILGMMSITSFAVIAFFNRNPGKASALAALICPLIAGVVMLGLFVYIFINFRDLTGTATLGIILPCLIPLAGLIGYAIASRLAVTDPERFLHMGESK